MKTKNLIADRTRREMGLPWLCERDEITVKELSAKGYDLYLRRLKPGVDLFVPYFLNRN